MKSSPELLLDSLQSLTVLGAHLCELEEENIDLKKKLSRYEKKGKKKRETKSK